MQKTKADNLQIAQQTFAEIVKQFPNIIVQENKNDPVEISLTIPLQSGVKFKVLLCFQNDDELQLNVAHFWMSWFPCADSEKMASYIDAVTGFLSGHYRVLEHYRGRWCVSAVLQKPHGDGWQNIGFSATLWGIFLRWLPKRSQEIRNV